MKKIIAILLCIVGINVNGGQSRISNEEHLSLISKLSEFSKIYQKYSSGDLTKNQYIKKLTACSNNNNMNCTAFLGNYYIDKDNSRAYSLLLKASTDKFVSNGDYTFAAVMASYDLGEMYLFGSGVLQNSDKALHYFTICVKHSGHKNSAIRIAQILGEKWAHDNKNYTSLIKSYAWWKIAQALPNGAPPIKDINGKITDPSELMKIFEVSESFRSHLHEANTLAKKICATIPECRK